MDKLSPKSPASSTYKERRASRTSEVRRERSKGRPKSGTRASSACIWKGTRIMGEVHIGEKTIIGPGCSCISKGGPIKIGSQNVLTERVEIINKSKEPMVIGDCNIFETGAKVEARRIGSNNLFAAKSVVLQDVYIGNGCVIGPMIQVFKKGNVSDYTIMAASNLTQSQKTFRRRNNVYVQKMVKLLSRQFQVISSKDQVKLSKRHTPRQGRSGDRTPKMSSRHSRSDERIGSNLTPRVKKDGGNFDEKVSGMTG